MLIELFDALATLTTATRLGVGAVAAGGGALPRCGRAHHSHTPFERTPDVMEFVLKRLFAAIHRTSHASALKATARTLLALSVALAMSRPLLTPDSLSGDVGVWLPITVFKFAAVLNRCILASLVVVLVLLLVFSRAGTRRLGLGATGRGLVGQAGLWVGVGAGLAVTEYALNPMWMYVEADPAEVLEVAVFGVLLGGALGILVGLSYERV